MIDNSLKDQGKDKNSIQELEAKILKLQQENYKLKNEIKNLGFYQNELSRLEKLNVIGQMSASIAHEIRNPMTSVRGYLQLFQRVDRYMEDKDAMDLMIDELDRVNDIITVFLSLAQHNTIDLKLRNLNDIIINLLPLLQADAMKNDIFIKTELNSIAQISIDQSEFRQLLLNLVRNGIEAMSNGGTLTVKTFEDTNGVNLNITDQGTGISPDVLNKIGTPFFTTKANGTGLGLAVCYKIAERYNAKITVNSSSEGTIFEVTFPTAE